MAAVPELFFHQLEDLATRQPVPESHINKLFKLILREGFRSRHEALERLFQFVFAAINKLKVAHGRSIAPVDFHPSKDFFRMYCMAETTTNFNNRFSTFEFCGFKRC